MYKWTEDMVGPWCVPGPNARPYFTELARQMAGDGHRETRPGKFSEVVQVDTFRSIEVDVVDGVLEWYRINDLGIYEDEAAMIDRDPWILYWEIYTVKQQRAALGAEA